MNGRTSMSVSVKDSQAVARRRRVAPRAAAAAALTVASLFWCCLVRGGLSLVVTTAGGGSPSPVGGARLYRRGGRCGSPPRGPAGISRMALDGFIPTLPDIPFNEIQVPVVTEFYRSVGNAVRVFSQVTGIGLTDHEHLSAGFVGGSVGVVMTLIAIELKKKAVTKDNLCPYCVGSGQLTCAQCCGTGTLVMSNQETGKEVSMACPMCGGRAQITCINCKGDGRSTPVMLDRKASRDPETEMEDVGMA